MSNHPVIYNSLEYKTNEHLFHVLRFSPISEIREQIRKQDSPMKAKVLAKIYADQMVIKPRVAEDLDNMRLCLMLKVRQHSELTKLLLATGDRIIAEDVTKRVIHTSGESLESALFWGMRQNPDNTWTGSNWMGKLWMELRTKLQYTGSNNGDSLNHGVLTRSTD